MNWYIDVLKKYAVFEGRARRKEYWFYTLFNFIFALISLIIGKLIGIGNVLEIIYSLVILLPGFAVSVRRLHDTNRSGWWLLIGLIPFVGTIIILIFTVLDSDEYSNKYGENPKFNEGIK